MTPQAHQQVWQAESYDKNARFVSDLAGAVLDWLDPQPGEAILDLGCGDGALTKKLADLDCSVIGIDSSQNFVEAAAALGLDVRLMNGEALEFEDEFDAVFSNAALHWMTNPEAVISGVSRALKPSGRFVAEFGGHGNVAAIITAMCAVARRRGGDEGPALRWFFPTPDEYSEILNAAGFSVKRIGLFPRPTPLPTGMRAWLKVFSSPFFAQFGEESESALDEVVELLAASLQDTKGNWTADYVRIRVEAELGS